MIKKIISGRLKTISGLHIGSGAFSETTDSPVSRNIDGKIIISGTALAGSLRALATRLAPHLGGRKCIVFDEDASAESCDCQVCDLFGSINTSKSTNEGTASKIWFYDAVLEHDLITSIRDGVGIDRETRTSARAARAKYDYEVIPKGSKFSFQLVFHDVLDEEQENILASVLKEWCAGRGYLGGSKARGLGNIKLEDIKLYTINLSNKDILMTYLKETNPMKAAVEEENWLGTKLNSVKSRVGKEDDYLYNSFVQIDFTLKFAGGFVINDALKAVQTGFDLCPKMEHGTFMMPGSSLRGAVRSHAEKIARTIVTLDSKTKEEFLIKCPACNPFANQKSPLTSCGSLFKEYKRKNSNVEIRDAQLCPACQLFGSPDKGSRLYFSDAYLTGPTKIKIMDFLAIDRFTGGGKEGAKFDAVVLWRPSFKARIFMDNMKEWHLGWLMLVLKDLNDGLVSFGFGQNKWFGKATTENETIKFGAVSKDFIPGGLKGSSSREGIFSTQVLTLKDLAGKTGSYSSMWINSFRERLLHFQREDDFYLRKDTYFQDDFVELYPKEVLL
jgi:CRISPR/Cas system CSM-associated protein Csm3 (group 7 of RAMP superfamily)